MRWRRIKSAPSQCNMFSTHTHTHTHTHTDPHLHIPLAFTHSQNTTRASANKYIDLTTIVMLIAVS